MVFSSAIFLFVFLPLFLAAYYLTPKKWRSYTLLLGSLIFYGWWRVDFLFLMLAVIGWSHMIAKHIVQSAGPLQAKKWLILGVGLNLGTLAVFKYFNFGMDSINTVLEQSGLNTFEAIRFILPIGISFYIFQAISFLVDVYRGDAPPARHIVDFAAFITLFPQLIAGPILRYKDLADQFEDRKHSLGMFSQGAHRFMIGFAKKVLIADTVAPLADAAFFLPNPSFADAWIGILAYTVQLYYDFSGYSDMAIGIGLMLGFRFMENFNQPYISQSVTEFWRRWHISLSTWLRDYLYIPLGGNRKGAIITYRNLMVTMALGGLWHGANWTFLLWGVWHGGIMAMERATQGDVPNAKGAPLLPIKVLKVILCTLLVMIGWVLFRAENLQAAWGMYQGMTGFSGIGISDAYFWQIKGMAIVALISGWALIYLQPLLRRLYHMPAREEEIAMTHSTSVHIIVIVLFVLAVSRLLAQNYSPFLYFQF